MTDATELDTAAIRARLEAATEGPWRFSNTTDPRGRKGEFRAPSPHNGFMIVGPWTNDADARFIAHARTDVERLLTALDEARTEVQRKVSAALLEKRGLVGDHTGNLAIDMAAYATRMKDRAEAAESALAGLSDHRICNARHGEVACYCSAWKWMTLDEYGEHIESLAALASPHDPRHHRRRASMTTNADAYRHDGDTRERVVRSLLEHPADPETEVRALVDALARAEAAETEAQWGLRATLERLRSLVENGPYVYYPVGLEPGFAKAIPVTLIAAALASPTTTEEPS